MRFLLDENVPAAVAETLNRSGYIAEFVRDHVPAGAPDPVVATVAQELDTILITFDKDFQKIAPKIPDGHKTRFRNLSRIWMRCKKPQASNRIEQALSFIKFEYGHAKKSRDRRMILEISAGFFKTQR